MSFGYDYTHSAVDGNGVEYISFMLEPERIDGNGLRYGKAVHIDIDNKRQKTMVYTFDWIRGGPANHEKIVELKDEVVGVLQTKVNRKNEKSPAKFTRPKMGITKQAGEKSHRQPG